MKDLIDKGLAVVKVPVQCAPPWRITWTQDKGMQGRTRLGRSERTNQICAQTIELRNSFQVVCKLWSFNLHHFNLGLLRQSGSLANTTDEVIKPSL
jgi:hypothetical protein